MPQRYSHERYVQEYYKPGGKRDQNDRSRDKAENEGQPWSSDEHEILIDWDTSEEELTVVAEILGRSREACRQRYYSLLRGDIPLVITETVTTTKTETPIITVTRTTRTTSYRYANWSDEDRSPWYA